MLPKAEMVPKECECNQSETACGLCAGIAWRFPCLPATARDGELIKMQNACDHVEDHKEDHKALQDDLTNLEDWSWNLCFNSNKCKVMHIGHSNPQHEYVMYSGGQPIMLDTTANEKYLGVHVDANLTFEHHVEIVVNKANRMLGMIRRAYTFLDGPTLTKLYTSLIRPLLEYSNGAWTPGTGA